MSKGALRAGKRGSRARESIWPSHRTDGLLFPPNKEIQLSSPPTWQAHHAADYDAKMQQRCDALLSELKDDPGRRREVLVDPRSLHRVLFHDLTPLGFEEYAGTFRGTVGTHLESRRSQVLSVMDGQPYELAVPWEVADRMVALSVNLSQLRSSANADHEKLAVAAYGFAWFGMIHPFLDGNGHIQRALFAAEVLEFGYPLNARFSIHPRPYDRLLAVALELFTRSNQRENDQLPLIVEYLGYLIDGPFASKPRAFLPEGASLYK